MKKSLRAFLFPLVLVGLYPGPLSSAPFSQSKTINFYREVVPRDIAGLGLRSDGRLMAGPVLRELAGIPRADLWWDLESFATDSWLVGTGPGGQVLQIEIDPNGQTYTATPWADAGSNHVLVVKKLHQNLVAGGTNPGAQVILWDATGREVARVALPADSVLDLLWEHETDTLWVATGNPGALYRMDVARVQATPGEQTLAERGVTLRAKIRDRNLRRLHAAPAGAILGGSAPGGNLYRFDADGSDPLILMDQESGEVTDLQVDEAGNIFATLVVATGNTRRRVMQAANVQAPTESEAAKESAESVPATPTIFEAPPIDAFTGRSELVKIPAGRGIPETLSSRQNVAMYRMAQYQDLMLIGGGDDGEIIGYHATDRRALSFPGSNSAQINDIEALPTPGDFLLLTNNPVGLIQLSFTQAGRRVARTGGVNLSTPSEIGSLRFNRIRDIAPDAIEVRMRANRGRDPVEGWTPWQTAAFGSDTWRVEDMVGTQVQIEVRLPEALAADAQLDQAELFYLPQNRRPVLRSFRVISPNFALSPRPVASSATGNLTLGQVIGSSPNPNDNPDEKARQALLSSSLIPQPGAQVITWSVSDADGDQLSATFSVRATENDAWIDLGVGLTEEWFQFDRRGLPEGTYFTRLSIQEEAPRAIADRHTIGFATDDLVIDLSAPKIQRVDVSSTDQTTTLAVDAEDALSRIASLRLVFNNGHTLELQSPTDGLLDARTESFVAEVENRLIGKATAVEVYVEDVVGNIAIKRIGL